MTKLTPSSYLAIPHRSCKACKSSRLIVVKTSDLCGGLEREISRAITLHCEFVVSVDSRAWGTFEEWCESTQVEPDGSCDEYESK